MAKIVGIGDIASIELCDGYSIIAEITDIGGMVSSPEVITVRFNTHNGERITASIPFDKVTVIVHKEDRLDLIVEEEEAQDFVNELLKHMASTLGFVTGVSVDGDGCIVINSDIPIFEEEENTAQKLLTWQPKSHIYLDDSDVYRVYNSVYLDPVTLCNDIKTYFKNRANPKIAFFIYDDTCVFDTSAIASIVFLVHIDRLDYLDIVANAYTDKDDTILIIDNTEEHKVVPYLRNVVEDRNQFVYVRV